MCNTVPVQPKVYNMQNIVMLLPYCKLHHVMDVAFRGLLTYSVEHIPSWEANQFSASQEIPRILRNLKVHYRVHKCPFRGLHVEKLRYIYITGYVNTKEYFNTCSVWPDQSQQQSYHYGT